MAGSSIEDSSVENNKSKKPKDSAFKQQRLPAWQPILTAGTVLPTFFVIGVAFIPIGVGMLLFSENVMEKKLDYTHCKDTLTQQDCSTVINSTDVTVSGCKCTEIITLNDDWEGEVFLYYGLTNFFQNHRRYVKSRDDSQLLGALSQDPSKDCQPFDKENGTGKAYVPCGAIANSLFNDQVNITFVKDDGSRAPLNLIRTGIAWDSDKKYKFRNPPGDLKEALKDYAKPRDWHINLWELDPENDENNGLQNEDLIIWMRTAALPNFRKLFRKIDHADGGPFAHGLPKGKYEVDITYRYRVTQFSGTKSLILSTTSILGGKNPFLGITYILVGSICLIMGVVFLFIHIKCGKQTNEMLNITSRTPYN